MLYYRTIIIADAHGELPNKVRQMIACLKKEFEEGKSDNVIWAEGMQFCKNIVVLVGSDYIYAMLWCARQAGPKDVFRRDLRDQMEELDKLAAAVAVGAFGLAARIVSPEISYP